MDRIPFIRVDNSLSAYVQGQLITVGTDHPYFKAILKALKNGKARKVLRLCDLKNVITGFMDRNFTKVVDNVVYYKDRPVHNVLTNRILEFMRQGVSPQPLILFFDNLMLNPSSHSVNQLYRFLANYHLPITVDGYFLAYKKITDDWKDFYTKTIDNSIGANPKMDRNLVSDDPNTACHEGLHVGALSYVKTFHANEGRCVIVKVNPRDAVSVPICDFTKMRVCEYSVVQENTEYMPLDKVCYDKEKWYMVPTKENQ